MPKRSESNGVDAWSESLPDSFIMCRDMRHTWRPFRAWWNQQDNAYDRVPRCGRCKTERSQQIGVDGSIVAGHYSYAEGYQAPKGKAASAAKVGRLRLEST